MPEKSQYIAFSQILKAKCKLVCFLFFSLFLAFPLIGQTVYIKGSLELQDGISDPVYNVLALRADSSIYNGQVYTQSDFVFEVNLDSIVCIKAASLGYEPLLYPTDEIIPLIDHQHIQLGKVQLKSNLLLKEVTITARRKSLTVSPTGYSVDVKNSYLSTYGKFDDVIKRIPGITVSPRGGIEVIGKTNPLFVLNGRRLTSTGDLERLDPKQIKTIHIDQTPGPEYDSSYDAVVRVETMDYSQEFYSVDLQNRFEYGRRPSNYSKAIIQRKDKNVTYGIEMQYNIPKDRQYDTEDKFVWINTDSVSTHRNAVLYGETRNVNLVPSLLWPINKNNRLEAIYRFNHNLYNSISDQDYISTVLGERQFIDTYLKEHEKKVSHNPSLFYIFEKDKHRLQLSADYYTANTDYDQDIEEKYVSEIVNNKQNFNDKYEIFGGTADYKTTIKKWQVSTGGKISGIKDDGKYRTNDEWLSSSLLKDNTYALYVATSGKIASFSLSAGLRAEWNNIDYSNTSYKKNIKSDYFDLFPSASIRYGGKKVNVSLAYNKNITRPSFSQLNPNKRYLDPISYMIGNPSLNPRIIHDVSLSVQHSDLIFIAAYVIRKNLQAGILELTPDNMIAYTRTNIPESTLLNFAAIYSLNRNWFKSNFLLQARFQDICFQEKVYSRFSDTPQIVVRANMDFNLWKNANFNLICYHSSNQKADVTKFKNSGYISFQLNQSFFQNKCRLSAGVEDVFKSSHLNTWDLRLNNAYVNMDSNRDSRYFYLTLQYRIGKMKTSRSPNSIIADEKNRL